MKTNYKGINIDGTPREIVEFIELMDLKDMKFVTPDIKISPSIIEDASKRIGKQDPFVYRPYDSPYDNTKVFCGSNPYITVNNN